MIDLKEKLKQDLINPTIINRGVTYQKIAKIIKANEKKNECHIRYSDKNGLDCNRTNVKVRVYDPCSTSWFPETGDIVEIEEINGEPLIVALHHDFYEEQIKQKNCLESDIHESDMSCDSLGGYII